jgi:hypothetical protein
MKTGAQCLEDEFQLTCIEKEGEGAKRKYLEICGKKMTEKCIRNKWEENKYMF